MASDNTEVNQVNILIANKEQEIKDLEDLRTQFEAEEWDSPQTPAEVAADPEAPSEDRTAAATAVTGQDPTLVNAEQSEPSPSTHDSTEEKSEEVVEEPEETAPETEESVDETETKEDDAAEEKEESAASNEG